MNRAISLGRGAEVIAAGDWNEEPEIAALAHWAAVAGWGALIPGCRTRWNSQRQIDWAVYRAHGAVGHCWPDDEAASDHKMIVFEWGEGYRVQPEPGL
eukprot:10120906-Alexandrium_andersonii.AAC.1